MKITVVSRHEQSSKNEGFIWVRSYFVESRKLISSFNHV